MKKILTILSTLCVFSLPAGAAIQMHLYQSGDDLVLTGSGSANTVSLSLNPFQPPLTGGALYPVGAVFRVGTLGSLRFYDGLVGPVNLSDWGVGMNATSGDGDVFGITGSSGSILLPTGYVSGQLISGSSLFENRTLADMGLTDGQGFVWTWGSGADADSLTLTIGAPVPEPAHYAALAAAGLLVLLAVRRRHKTSV